MNIQGVKSAIDEGNDEFFFSRNASANREADRLLAQASKQINDLLKDGVEKSWNQGEGDFWNKVKSSYSDAKATQEALDAIQQEAIRTHLNKTAQSFYNEKRNGFNISDRVWDLNGNAKKEMEVIIQNGIKEGKSAAEIQKGLKGFLNDPDKLFRRVRNKETGELEWSKAAQQYHPGRGVYRSSYKNAMRLAVTEISAAYRRAEWESYQNNPLIIGYEICLSNNHTTLRNGVPVPLKDICDELQGRYPKEFLWTGWHPQCRCYMRPILISAEELEDYIQAKLNGTLDKWKPKNPITKPPKAFEEWVRKNSDRIEKANNRGVLPSFLMDNIFKIETLKEYPNGGIIKEYKIVDKTNNDYERIRSICECFAKQGNETVILPKIHYKDPLYKEAFSGLIGTKYEQRCPDFKNNGIYYEHEGFDRSENSNPKRTFSNMISRGLNQSNFIVVDNCGVGSNWAERSIHERIKKGADIKEVWILEETGLLRRLF